MAHGIDIAGMLDEPAANPVDPPPFDEWLDDLWDEPSFTREGSFVVSADGTPAALTLLYIAPEAGRGLNAFTATLPEFRGRGLALAAKVASLRWAAANGITQVSTANDDMNAPMLATQRAARLRTDRTAADDAAHSLDAMKKELPERHVGVPSADPANIPPSGRAELESG